MEQVINVESRVRLKGGTYGLISDHMKQGMITFIGELEGLNALKTEKRFNETIKLENQLEKSLEWILRSTKILLVTGFCIKEVMIGETDGPIGTVVLGSALEQIGKKVDILTDKYSYELVSEGINHYELNAELLDASQTFVNENSENFFINNPYDLVIFIERPSRNQDGHYVNMRGNIISDVVQDTDILLTGAKCQGITTIGIGDGGNEVGMNRMRGIIERNFKNGKVICSSTDTDFLIVSAVSNWGCYALCCGLSYYTGKNLLPEVEFEIEHLRRIVKKGGVDGCSKKRTASVDGYSIIENMEVLDNYRSLYLTFSIDKKEIK